MRYIVVRGTDVEMQTQSPDDDLYQESMDGDVVVLRVEDDVTVHVLDAGAPAWEEVK